MVLSLELQVNGQPRTLGVEPPLVVESVVRALELRGDRIAVEQNGSIVPRTRWASQPVLNGDRLEIVHFVGGGSSAGWHRDGVVEGPWDPSA